MNSPGMLSDDAIAGFITIDLVREQLAVVKHYLATTPDTPFTETRRRRLEDDRALLAKMIDEHMSTRNAMPATRNSDEGSLSSETAGGRPSPESSLNTPPIVWRPPFLADAQISVSGFSTPDILPTGRRDEDPFASVREELILPEADRLAQELA
jgi:hypothetical protein